MSVAALLLLSLTASVGAPAQVRETPEAVSLLGEPLYAPEPTPERKAKLEADLEAALVERERNPKDSDALIWVGRRAAYLSRYREAIEIFSQGISQDPDNPRIYRHRGHRYLTTRQLDRAAADFERAARLIEGKPDEIEPDGIPNARNQPRSTLHSNIWYHLGLAHYLKGDFEKALSAYRRCMEVSTNDDMLVATSHWLYMTLRRLGRDGAAAVVLEPIHSGMDIVENDSYLSLLLMYKGEKSPEEVLGPSGDDLASATVGYGVGNWHLYNGRPGEAREIFRRIVREQAEQWAAFGYLAAEAELARSPE